MPLWALSSCLTVLALACVFFAWAWWDTSNLYERELARRKFLAQQLKHSDEVVQRLMGRNPARRERVG